MKISYDDSEVKVGDLVVSLKTNRGFTYRVTWVPRTLGQTGYYLKRGSTNLEGVTSDSFRKIKIDSWVGVKVYTCHGDHHNVMEGVVIDGPYKAGSYTVVRLKLKESRKEHRLENLVPMNVLDMLRISNLPNLRSSSRSDRITRKSNPCLDLDIVAKKPIMLVSSETEGDLLAELHHQLEQKEVLISFRYLLNLRGELEDERSRQSLGEIDGFICGLVGADLWKKICYLMTTEQIRKRLRGGS